jgi:hypothetical protein
MHKILIVALLPFLAFFDNGGKQPLAEVGKTGADNWTGTMKKMIVASGEVAIDLSLERISSKSVGRSTTPVKLRFDAEENSFFTIVTFNDELRGPLPSSMPLVPKDSVSLPSLLGSSYGRLVIENLAPGGKYELAVRDASNGFTFFNVEGHLYEFNPFDQSLSIQMGRLLLSEEYAAELGRPGDAGSTVGDISVFARMRAVEVTEVVEGETVSETLPANTMPGTTPGPDVVVGDVVGLAQFGSADGSKVGLAVGTDSCNYGTQNLNWFANPSNDHPVIPQNLYRMSGGTDNAERLEQIGQSSVKHAFTALTQNLCALGCNGVGGSQLGSGCSDPYSASLNAGPSLGSKAWINPYTGFFPRNDSATPNNNHTGHTHTGPSHRILTEISDLNTTLNPGATYYAEAQYVTPHEYAWCIANPGQCNMFNNVSYRRYNVTGTGSPFSFSAAGSTVREKPAVYAWTGATLVNFRPDTADGMGIVAYKVTNPSPGVWHYEYAIYNQNLDRAVQSFSVPFGNGATVINVGFKAPPQHPGWTADGTLNNAGFSSTPWNQNLTAALMTWSSETFAQNQNANAIRWGTMYNFRFDSNRPPQTVNATLGFFKTGNPMNVQVQAPSPAVAVNVSVSGRVTNASGRPVYAARVTMTDSQGNTRIALTNPFGYYRFLNVLSGQTYNMGVRSKEYTFTPRDVVVNDNLTDVNFVAQ